ncbi:MAG: LVIVD repeat-containing protein [Actinomycetota bacterium]
MRTRFVAIVVMLSLGAVPGTAGGQVANPVDQVFASDNVTVVDRLAEGAGAISMQFDSGKPLMYLSTVKGLQIYDVDDPRNPQLLSALPLPHFQNEAMSLGERRNGDAFVLIASTLAAATTTGEVDPGTARFVVVVEVTDPANPEVVATLETPTRTHTVSCSSKSCPFAYSDGRSQGAMSIIDLRNFREPKVAGTYQSVVPQGHDEDLDDEGILWHVGGQGAVALDISQPTNPVPLNSTNEEGVESDDRTNEPYNNFILHNSTRPNARRFTEFAEPSLANGNVLLATEEDTGAGPCGPELGSFQTWSIPHLDAARYAEQNPNHEPGRGSIAPIDMWYPEDAAVGANCSAHYFDFHDAGFVAQGWYEYGTRILDVRDPSDIKQVGYFFTPASETWAAYWVPARNNKGAANGRQTNIVYTTDVGRGVDILEVGLPTDKKPKDTQPVEAPVMPASLLALRPNLSQPSKDWGFLCRVPQR